MEFLSYRRVGLGQHGVKAGADAVPLLIQGNDDRKCGYTWLRILPPVGGRILCR